jgi:type II secretory pathway pseudopilin PulG
MDKEMEAILAKGGIKDDGMNRDPISGNEVPPGSLAKEVRDDVDAKLSEGEYVVPADVVRFFGVAYFEKLRDKAKAGLQKMDEDGRIGGDPVPMDDDFPFSDEELMSVDDEDPLEMAEGGSVSSFNPAAFQPGFSFGMTGGAGQGLPSETRVFVNAQGEVRSILFINGQPIQQIPEGFVEDTPENRARLQASAAPQTASVEAVSSGGRDRDRDSSAVGIQAPQTTKEGGSGFSLGEEDSAALDADPLAFGLNAIKNDELFSSRRLGGVGSLVAGAPGMVIGGVAGAGMELENVARARAALLLAKDRNLTDSPQYAELEKELEKAEGRLSGAAKLMDAVGFGSGENYAKSLMSASQTSPAPMTPQAIPTVAQTTSAPTRTEMAGVSYNTTESRSRDNDGRETVTQVSRITPGTSAAPTASVRPKPRPERPSTSSSSASSTRTASEARASAQRAADRAGRSLATGGRAKGGLVQRPKKKPVAKK